jgi:hypothetical protein
MRPTQRPLPDYTQHSQQTDIHAPTGFEPTIPASEQPQTHALDRAAPGAGKGRYTLLVKLSDFTVWRHTWRKNWAVLTGISAGLRTVLFSRLSRRELRSSLKALNSFSRWTLHDIFHFKYHFLLHILRFLFFFSDNIMADVASKQQTTALFLSTIDSHTYKKTHGTDKKNWQMWRETCAVPENIQFSFFVQLFYTVKLHSLT